MDTENEDGNNNNNYTYTDIRIRIRKNKLTLYVPQQFHQTVYNLDQITHREGSSISEWFRNQAKNYVSLHTLGNPQQTIQRFLEGKQAYISADPCFLGCGRPSEFLACYGNNERRFKICSVHADCIRHNSLKRNFQYQKWMIVGEIKP